MTYNHDDPQIDEGPTIQSFKCEYCGDIYTSNEMAVKPPNMWHCSRSCETNHEREIEGSDHEPMGDTAEEREESRQQCYREIK